MTLFGATKPTTNQPSLKDLEAMVEKYFERRQLTAARHRLSSAHGIGWWIMEGSAKVFIFLVEDNRGFAVRITSPINYVPETNRVAFYHHLLEVNRDLSGVSIAIFKDVVLVTGQRSTTGLDQEELNDLVWTVSYVADTLDNQLLEKFNARMYDEAR